MSVVGSNPDQLEETARQLDEGAAQLDRSAKELAATLGSFSWLGRAAIAFTDSFSSRHKPRMVTTAAFLRDNARALREQAHQQRRASEAGGAGGGRGLGGAAPWFVGPGAGLLAGGLRLLDNKDFNRSHSEALRQHQEKLSELERRREQTSSGWGDRIRQLPLNPKKSALEELDDQIAAEKAAIAREQQLVNMTAGDRQFLALDNTPGDHRTTEVYGNLATAKRVIIHIPGLNTDVGDYENGGHQDALRLLAHAGSVRGSDDVAVISFADWNVPDDNGEVLTYHGAKDGGPRLRALVDSLHAQGFTTDQISVVAHSYGTVVLGEAMQNEVPLAISRAVVLGSPGLGADSRDELGSPDVEVYAGSAPWALDRPGRGALGDFVGQSGNFGRPPNTYLPTIDVGDAYGHSSYFGKDSQSLDAITRAALGRS